MIFSVVVVNSSDQNIKMLQEQVRQLQADKEMLAATASSLGDHLCKVNAIVLIFTSNIHLFFWQVITERENQFLQMSTEKERLLERLASAQQP